MKSYWPILFLLSQTPLCNAVHNTNDFHIMIFGMIEFMYIILHGMGLDQRCAPPPRFKQFSDNIFPSLESTRQKPHDFAPHHWSGPGPENPPKIYRQPFGDLVFTYCIFVNKFWQDRSDNRHPLGVSLIGD